MHKPTIVVSYIVTAALVITFLPGCVVKEFKDIGNTVEQTVKGDYYLKSGKYEQGRESFRNEIEENPDSALAHYYFGRFLLQNGEKKQALVQLEQARALDPRDVDYNFWAGVAYGETGDKQKEAEYYRAALKLDGNHLQSLIYLGHNQLEKKHYKEALNLYNRALDIWPGSPSSLYNRALIFRKLGRTPEEKLALHEYLARYPSGGMARRATRHLNILADYSYRNHQLGARAITIEKIRFETFTAQISTGSEESLKVVGSVMKNMQNNTLQVVYFQKNNKSLAKRRALAIKSYLIEEFPQLTSRRIGVSWFDEPQQIVIKDKKRRIDESASFFVTDDQ